MTDRLLKAQKDISEKLTAKREAFSILAVERRTRLLVEERLREVRALWAQFRDNDMEIRLAQDIDGGHSYFSNRHFEKIQDDKSKFELELEQVLHDLEKYAFPTHPQGVRTKSATAAAAAAAAAVAPDTALTANDNSMDQDPPGAVGPVETNHLNISLNQQTNGSPGGLLYTDPAIISARQSQSNLLNISHAASSQHSSSGNSNRLNTILPDLLQNVADSANSIDRSDRNLYEGQVAAIANKWANIESIHRKLMMESTMYDPAAYLQMEDRLAAVIMAGRRVLMGTTAHNQIPAVHAIQSSAKLPKLTIPKFQGDSLKWQSFKELFQRMVANQAMLSDAEKLAYLKGQLEGEALRLVAALPVTDGNYITAWNTLNERYSNQHMLIMKLLKKISAGPAMRNNSLQSMKEVMDSTHTAVNMLVNMRIPDRQLIGNILYFMVEHKLDSESLKAYTNTLTVAGALRSYENLKNFMQVRIQNFDVKAQPETDTLPKVKSERKAYGITLAVSTSRKGNESDITNCDCKEKHIIYQCPKFLAMQPEKRFKKVCELKKCVNCLRDGHRRQDCKLSKCRTCKKNHHTLLHFERKAMLSSATEKTSQHVFLATVVFEVMDKNGDPIKMRALLDSGSQINMMTDKMHKKLGLRYNQASLIISGIGAHSVESKKRTMIAIKSLHTNYNTSLEVFVVNKMTTCQPSEHVDTTKWKIPGNITLADPKFNVPDRVDIIIGGEIFFRLLSNGHLSLGKNLPDIQNTVFGWVVIGKMLGLEQQKVFAGVSTLDEQVSQFWKIEEKCQEEKQLTKVEKECEQVFQETTQRDPKTGQYIVKLQFLKEPSLMLGQSEVMAIRRFKSIERKLMADPQMREEYVNFMKEYEQLGHMHEIPRSKLGENFYVIPHHAVRNPSSSTTKLRVVFDASAKTTTNIALNEILANGPMIQDNLFEIMVRFRQHEFVFSADITKMYRQVLVAPEDRKWQTIVWREDPADQLKFYELATLTYGTTCASYLAIKTLHRIAEDNASRFPMGAEIAKRDFNVDDVMTGANSLKAALQIQRELMAMLEPVKFSLHKWCANHPALLKVIPKDKQEVSLDIHSEKQETKALGMKWIPRADIFKLSYSPKEHKEITKRNILSETAQLFDPLGLVNPVIVLAKIFLQELWSSKLDWDDLLPDEMQKQWKNFRGELPQLNEVQVQRALTVKNPTNIQIHAFSDASIRAYGTAVYMRSESATGDIQVNLICSKSRVAPVSATTLPRLELCAAVTMTDLVDNLKKTFRLNIDSVTYWTDSELVLAWLFTDTTYKTFVANRVAAIKRKTNIHQWKYIYTKENPADLVSRGVMPEQLMKSRLWWHGPEFLQQSKDKWPIAKAEFVREPSEERTIKTILTASVEDHFIKRINHGNSFRTLERVVAYILRWKLARHWIKSTEGERRMIEKCADRQQLSPDEIKNANKFLIRYMQKEHFQAEYKLIEQGNGHRTKFGSFVPIIDADKIIRVGGRLHAANVSFEQQHPALLPKGHPFTKMLMDKIHLANMHAGPQALLAITRQRFWPENGKTLAQLVVKNCVRCARSKPQLMEQIMGSLPRERVTQARPFVNVGLDFAGPITIYYKIRGKRPTKAYMCLFVCFATKAVHIEAAADLTTEGFLACLRRFIARRGVPSTIFCDNATNFIGASSQLEELHQVMTEKSSVEKIENYCTDHSMKWKFIPPRSPHFGGLHEAAIKSAKYHLKKVTHSYELTLDELFTVLAEIEAILNSRPLTPLSNDPNDLQPLTPGHFLIGAPMNCINDTHLQETSKVKMWAKAKQIRTEFWERWTKEVLAELQNRHKWTKNQENIQVGRMVILKDSNLPPLAWKIARVEKVIPGPEGKVRVIEVRTSSGTPPKSIVLKRAIHEISPLPVISEPDDNQMKTPVNETRIPEDDDTPPQVVPQMPPEEEAPVKPLQRTKKAKGLNPVAGTLTPRVTRSMAKNLSTAQLLLCMFGLMAILIMGTSAKECPVIPFSNQPGLYYEKIGEMSLTNDEWNIIAYIDTEPFWDQVENIEKLIDKIDEACAEISRNEYCNVTRMQLRHRVIAVKRRDEIINEFTRGKSTRSKRGWINLVGSGLHVVTGVLDSDDGERYDTEISKLRKDYNYAMQLMNNQTSIMEITENIVRKEEEQVAKQIAKLQNEIVKKASFNTTEHQIYFSNLAMQVNTLLNIHAEMQKAIIDLILDIHHGRITGMLITPKQLRIAMRTISMSIDKQLMVPGEIGSQDVAKLYKILTAKVHVMLDKVIVKISVPLIQRDSLKLHHIVPVPFYKDGQLKTIKNYEPYIGITNKEEKYYLMSHDQYKRCIEYSDSQFICEQNYPLYSSEGSKLRCEMAIFSHTVKGISPECDLSNINGPQAWTKLKSTNRFVFSVVEQITVNMICSNHSTPCMLEHSGIFDLAQKCIIKSGNLEISSHNVISEDLNVLIDPAFNASDVFSEIREVDSLESPMSVTIDPQLDIVEQAILMQRERESYIPAEHNVWHHVHHYILVYGILIILILVLIWFCYITRCTNPRKIFTRYMSQRGIRYHRPSAPIELKVISNDNPENPSTRALVNSVQF